MLLRTAAMQAPTLMLQLTRKQKAAADLVRDQALFKDGAITQKQL